MKKLNFLKMWVYTGIPKHVEIMPRASSVMISFLYAPTGLVFPCLATCWLGLSHVAST